jgi:hypothetical protein
MPTSQLQMGSRRNCFTLVYALHTGLSQTRNIAVPNISITNH